MKKYSFVILSLRINNGGPIVLNRLCKCLSELGYNAKVFYPNRLSYDDNHSFQLYVLYKYFGSVIRDVIFEFITKIIGEGKIKKYKSNPVKGCKRKILPFVGKNTIVIYPEIVFGNPLKAKKVVRWLLYHNIHYKEDGEKTIGYDKNDLFFTYREVFNDPKYNPECRILHTPFFDLELYKRTNYGKREGKCFIIRKGAQRSDLPNSFDGVIIDDLPEKEKVRIFNECEYCISYDTQTAYSSIAAMCGCISVVVPEEGKTRKDYQSDGEQGYGKAYGFDESEIKFAIDTRDKIREDFLNLNNTSKQQVNDFVLTCENYFGVKANEKK